jgi:aminoglycoside phosphotransferase (APT) family kinase protein
MLHKADPFGEQLTALLQETVGGKTSLRSYQVNKQLDDYAVIFARLGTPDLDVVIKLAGPQAVLECPFEQTTRLHERVRRQTNVPVAEILAVDVSYQSWPWRYLIARHVPGKTLASIRGDLTAAELADAQRQIGEAVAQLHTIHFPLFGAPGGDGELSWRNALKQRATRFIQGKRSQALFLSVLEQQAHLFEPVGQPSLCHEDLHHFNILFQPHQNRWQLAAILDFDKAWAGHPESDLARLEIWHGMTGNEFWQAYQTTHTLDPRYPQRRAVYQLFWCLEYARPTAAHLADTRQVCAVLGIAPIQNFD